MPRPSTKEDAYNYIKYTKVKFYKENDHFKIGIINELDYISCGFVDLKQ